MFTLHFSEGKEFTLGYRLLKVLAEHLPDTEEYAELAEALLALGIPSLTEELVGQSILKKDQYDAIWETGNLTLRRKLVKERSFLENLTDAQVKDIIDTNDCSMLISVAEWAELFYPDSDNEDQAARLSGGMADALLKHISIHPDERVREALYNNGAAPAKFSPSLKERIEQNLSNLPLAHMSVGDIDALASASLETMRYVAGNIEDIRDKEVSRKVAKTLLEHPDPSVRLDLAENCRCPTKVLKALLDDPDFDVASTARRELSDRYEIDD